MRTTLKALSPLSLPDALLAELETLYATPGRAYHTLHHVLEVAHGFASLAKGTGWRAPREVFVALLYHDAIYVPGATDNEARSADVARTAIAAHALEVDADRVAHLIELTAHHGKLGDTKLDADEALFLDCDMAILASDARRFALYDRQIAQEYSAVPPELYRQGRDAFLGKLRDAERIFHSAMFHDALDWRARANLARALGLADIVQAGTPVLRERAAELDPTHIGSVEMQALFRRMIDAMRAAPGVGLAAPQLGLGLRIFVLEDRPEYVDGVSELEREERGRVAVPAKIFVNPTLTPIGAAKVGFFEGCLSVEGYTGWVERWTSVEVHGLDEHGQPHAMRATGWPARILQHEYDHLDGTLYIDRMVTRSFSAVHLAHERYAGKSGAEVRALLGLG